LARIACGMGSLVAIGVFVLGMLTRVAGRGSLSPADVPDGWSVEAFRTALAQLGLTVGQYHVYRMALDAGFALCFFVVGALLLWRRSAQGVALYVALFLMTFGAIWPTNLDQLAALYPAWSWLYTLADQLSLTFLLAFFFFFPDGRFVPRWMLWLVAV